MNNSKIKSCVAALLLSACPMMSMADMVWYDGSAPVTYSTDTKYDLVVGTAMDMFASDMEEVTGHTARRAKVSNSTIVLTQLDRASKSQKNKLTKIGVPVDEVAALTDGFNITVNNGKIYVTGANGRGTAYGLLELSRKAGVSPWIWWGDVKPQKKSKLELPDDYSTTQGASVEYRGIFLNDEDWSSRPWSYTN